MNLEQYQQLFEEILASDNPPAPYDNPDYLNYTRLNRQRMNRWFSTLQLNEALVTHLQKLDSPQHWIVLLEPWCGDVSHSLPFIIRLAETNPFISYDLQLRDSEPFLINDYLTAGSKGIPKLIVRDEVGKDIFVWGPRPAAAQHLMNNLKAEGADFERIKIEVQNWYNANKGRSLQEELLAGFGALASQNVRA